eukprot:16449909-Heterocapsa_arctica.AAC.1
MAVKLHSIVDRVVSSQRWPWRWKGGRTASLWKRGRLYRNCDNSRGFLVSNHAGKVLPDLIKGHLAPHIILAQLPTTLFGGIEGGATDFPNHTLRMLEEYARVSALSFFMCFIDHAQAYDRV